MKIPAPEIKFEKDLMKNLYCFPYLSRFSRALGVVRQAGEAKLMF